MSTAPVGPGPAAGGEPAASGAGWSRPVLQLVPGVSARRRLRASRGPFLVLVVGLLSAGLVGLLMVNTALAQGAFELGDLQRRVADLSEEQQRLEQQLAREASPARLASRAERLGMVPSDNPAFIRASDGAILGEPTPAATPPPPPPPRPTAAQPSSSPAAAAPAATAGGPASPDAVGAEDP